MEDFWMERRYTSCNFNLPYHYENTYQILFVLKGKILYKVGTREYEVSKGGIIVLNTLEEHTLKVLEYPYERYLIQIRPEYFQNEVKYPEVIALFIKRPADFFHLLTVSEPVWNSLYDIVLEMEQEYKGKKKYWDIYIGANLRRMFIILFRECTDILSGIKLGSGVRIAYNIMNYLNHHYTEDITIDKVALALFMNKDYMAHLFRDETGYSLIGYVISLRINRAKLLLSETDKSISDIAVECGYSDFTYFSKQFKKHTNLSPSKFRKEAYQQRIDMHN
jgi:YesN/AraC family two-component response regulator